VGDGLSNRNVIAVFSGNDLRDRFQRLVDG
jgi:hypothetical protein